MRSAKRLTHREGDLEIKMKSGTDSNTFAHREDDFLENRLIIMFKLIVLALVTIVLSWYSLNKETKDVKVSSEIFPVESVIARQYTESRDVNLYKKSREVGTISIHSVDTVLPDGTFEGISTKRSKNVYSLGHPDTATELSPSARVSYITEKPFKFIGSTSSDDYEVAAVNHPLPKEGKVGDKGGIYESVIWTDSTKAIKVKWTMVNWQLFPASENTAWLCKQILVHKIGEATVNDGRIPCLEIDAKGNVLDEKFSVLLTGEGKSGQIVFASEQE